MTPGTVRRSLGIYFKAEETLENLRYEIVNERCATTHRLKWGLLPSNEVVRNAQHVRKKERKGRNEIKCNVIIVLLSEGKDMLSMLPWAAAKKTFS